jgi:hypothetical protein
MGNALKKSTGMGSRLWRFLRRVALLLAISLVGFYVVFYFAQTSLIAQGEPGLSISPRVLDWSYKEVTVPVGDESTHAWFLPLENAKGVVLYCHGNGGNLSQHFRATGMHRALGFSTLIFDYGGFGRSTGQPTEKRIYADARVMWKWLTETKGIPPDRIVIWGTSFGGGVACQLATEVEAGALVLESTYLSVPEAASDHTPYVPWGLLIRSHLANKNKIGDVLYPVMIIHSNDDTLFPIRHGRGLFERANEPKILIETHGDHYGGATNKDQYLPAMTEFLDRFFEAPERAGAPPANGT